MEFPRACDVAARIDALNASNAPNVTRYIASKRDKYIAAISSAIQRAIQAHTTRQRIAVDAEIENEAVAFEPITLYTDKVEELCNNEIAPRLREAGWCIDGMYCFAYDNTAYRDGHVVVRVHLRFA
jgi:hypothetical protein